MNKGYSCHVRQNKSEIRNRLSKGFTALITIILVSFGMIALALSALSGAVLYADAVETRELRIQAGLNAAACLDSAKLVANKDVFAIGSTSMRDFGCDLRFGNDFKGNITTYATSTLEGIKATASGTLFLSP